MKMETARVLIALSDSKQETLSDVRALPLYRKRRLFPAGPPGGADLVAGLLDVPHFDDG